MSTSLKVVSIAAVCCASTRRRAIVARRFDMRTRSSRALAGRSALRLGRRAPGRAGRSALARGAGGAGSGRSGRGAWSLSLHVRLRDARAIGLRPLPSVDVLLAREPCAPTASPRRCAFAVGGLRRRCAASGFAGAGFGDRSRSVGRRALGDRAEHVADLHVGAVVVRDLLEHAGSAAPTPRRRSCRSRARRAARRRRPRRLPSSATWRRARRRSTRPLGNDDVHGHDQALLRLRLTARGYGSTASRLIAPSAGVRRSNACTISCSWFCA